MKSKIGIGIITCNRNSFLQRCVKSIQSEWYDELIIINDGDIPIKNIGYNIINNKTNLGVGKTKNIALKYLMKKNVSTYF
jgi:glycosyltransferase involved in cell wall biosynthesis